jgi:hypothetical protein
VFKNGAIWRRLPEGADHKKQLVSVRSPEPADRRCEAFPRWEGCRAESGQGNERVFESIVSMLSTRVPARRRHKAVSA